MSKRDPQPVSDTDEFAVLRSRLRSMSRFGPGDFPILSEAADAIEALIERAESAERERDEARRGLASVVADLHDRRKAFEDGAAYFRREAQHAAADASFEWAEIVGNIEREYKAGLSGAALTRLLAEAEERGRVAMRGEAAAVLTNRLRLVRRSMEKMTDADGDVPNPEAMRAAERREDIYARILAAIRALPTTPTPSEAPK